MDSALLTGSQFSEMMQGIDQLKFLTTAKNVDTNVFSYPQKVVAGGSQAVIAIEPE